MGRVIEATGAGRTVREGDPEALAAAVLELLGSASERDAAAEAGRAWAAARSWPQVARPLLEYATKPWRDRHRDRFTDLAPDASRAEEPAIRRVARALRRLRGRR